MSSCPYAKLLVNMYEFPKKDTHVIVQLLTEEDKEVIKQAIATLENRPSGDRMQIIVYQYFGIECERKVLREIAASFAVPVTSSFARQLRINAERYLRKVYTLRPLVERITDAGIESDWTKETLRLPTPEEIATLKAAVSKSESVGEGQLQPSEDWRNISVDALGFSNRTSQCLRNYDICTIGELCSNTEATLMRASNFGRKSLLEVKAALHTIGKHLDS